MEEESEKEKIKGRVVIMQTGPPMENDFK